MISRASGPLLVAYLTVIIAGSLFVVTPSEILSQVTEYRELLFTWGMFYVLGGVISSASLLLRKIFKRSVSLWYFELSGIALIVSANLIYAYALGKTGQQFGENNILALSMILVAFSAGLIARTVETLRLVKILRKVTLSPRS